MWCFIVYYFSRCFVFFFFFFFFFSALRGGSDDVRIKMFDNRPRRGGARGRVVSRVRRMTGGGGGVARPCGFGVCWGGGRGRWEQQRKALRNTRTKRTIRKEGLFWRGSTGLFFFSAVFFPLVSPPPPAWSERVCAEDCKVFSHRSSCLTPLHTFGFWFFLLRFELTPLKYPFPTRQTPFRPLPLFLSESNRPTRPFDRAFLIRRLLGPPP